MWVEGKRRSWLRTVVLGGRALPRIWKRTVTATAISVVVTVLYERVGFLHYSITTAPFVLIGLPLGIYLGFRSNSAYDRFWEGRKLWGQLVNTSRSLTRQVLTLLEPQPDATDASPEAIRALQVRLVHMLVAYVHALRCHLRDEDALAPMAAALPDEELALARGDENPPIALLHRMGERLAEARRNKWIHPLHVTILEQSLVSLTDIQGACERIKSTPIPYSYTVLLHRIVAVYCTLLPLGLMDTIGWATPFVVLGISYALFGLDAIGDEVEQPFGTDTNDLPLEAIATMIETNLRRRLGEPVPPRVVPRANVLS